MIALGSARLSATLAGPFRVRPTQNRKILEGGFEDPWKRRVLEPASLFEEAVFFLRISLDLTGVFFIPVRTLP